MQFYGLLQKCDLFINLQILEQDLQLQSNNDGHFPMFLL